MAESMKHLKDFPKEFKDEEGNLKTVDIICNECSRKSLKVPFNPIGLKCQHKDCGTYLTDMLWIILIFLCYIYTVFKSIIYYIVYL